MVTVPSVPAVFEMVGVALMSYFLTPSSEPKLTDEVQEAISVVDVGQIPDLIGIRNRALKHVPQRAIYLLAQIFNAILRTHQFPTVLKHAGVISILKPG